MSHLPTLLPPRALWFGAEAAWDGGGSRSLCTVQRFIGAPYLSPPTSKKEGEQRF